ncbi:TDP-N-acetylfucosamine:lipid II N-acetylfucosaminyltransferase [Aliarcobacter skirrowii]|uniref:4-alpha-L-fucosyltransferase n=1 Tax=Aliarcobacter skirrowii CCUG 10374 TaxID=1032239 RepID=A0AAD0SMR2_9BACT|nr:TDP-N-acetylfucosamine:lipid II N-acetylfucosaminyltransferase [Aliarcobacter skirrowii]AXX85656.1 4-alpha-L-fucosyltransferase [Aliarcobacter skirrowii CCUG 10374]KAB0620937.1 hypothetical protein F7P70_04125 [Aliarcobacter skirrowii CCUG 10374]MDX4062294.1 TDP-N-acetylfucosamine:lipid II N-acetylfucosaminyltransferase [Aliarcobacter skirrowii]RXI26109.1 hypothetical protein CP959_04125 [Aliarcobacter skirrowii CCUG 10374]SUU95808.1 4-alpha-L-fucosyltransferase [Aliarcobacter skirrowii]
MSEHKILHVMILDKFLASYIEFIDKNFGRENHHYVFITSEKYEYGLTPEHKVEFLHTDDDIFITLLKYMKMAKKIILHGLWRDKVDILLYFNQELLKKCYWVMWGGDFYFPETKSNIRKEIIKNMGYCITSNNQEFLYLKNCYDTSAKSYEFIFYPINLCFTKPETTTKNVDNKVILVGNSATETNRHLEIFYILKNYSNISIVVPLSYGNSNYKTQIIAEGQKIFGNRFKPILDLMTYDDYIDLLKTIDIAIFNNNRQQAGGNILTLLGLGKTIYLSDENLLSKFCFDKGLKFNNIKSIYDNLNEISTKDKIKNYMIIKEYCSEHKSYLEWKKIFE